MNAIDLAESGRIPDWLIRLGIRRLIGKRIAEITGPDGETELEAQTAFLRELRESPIAIETTAANDQHYEVPAAFYEAVLGPRLKYSSAFWAPSVETLSQAEACMLSLTARRAQIEDGMRVLDLGCGWGSVTLWIAERHPNCRIVAVSNSKSQREHILARCADRGLSNVEVVTADVNGFEPDGRFDRVVSVEMFEHVRNHALLMQRISRWLVPDGKLFVHIFCHRRVSYPYTTDGDDDWMGRHFFTGGMMPSDAHLLHFQDDLSLERQWRLGGEHYQKTSEAWLRNLDLRRERAREALVEAYGERDADLWLQRWRIFFLACAELFGYRAGNEWWVSHYRFRQRGSGGATS